MAYIVITLYILGAGLMAALMHTHGYRRNFAYWVTCPIWPAAVIALFIMGVVMILRGRRI